MARSSRAAGSSRATTTTLTKGSDTRTNEIRDRAGEALMGSGDRRPPRSRHRGARAVVVQPIEGVVPTRQRRVRRHQDPGYPVDDLLGDAADAGDDGHRAERLREHDG